jgi:S1-C subfamily serine protease
VADGALIVNVDPGSPAEQAGVLPGDVVVGVDGVAVDASSPFANLVALVPAGEELDLFVVRGDEQLVIPVVPQLIAGVPS